MERTHNHVRSSLCTAGRNIHGVSKPKCVAIRVTWSRRRSLYARCAGWHPEEQNRDHACRAGNRPSTMDRPRRVNLTGGSPGSRRTGSGCGSAGGSNGGGTAGAGSGTIGSSGSVGIGRSGAGALSTWIVPDTLPALLDSIRTIPSGYPPAGGSIHRKGNVSPVADCHRRCQVRAARYTAGLRACRSGDRVAPTTRWYARRSHCRPMNRCGRPIQSVHDPRIGG